jgi:predicted naringenin-chalcone synthase
MYGGAAGLATTLTALYRRSGVKSRRSVLVEPQPAGEPAKQTFYRPATTAEDRGPTTRERMEQYETEAIELAMKACVDALRDSKTQAKDITHLITVSCSGFEAPGVDIELIERLGLNSEVSRSNVGFMGCHGAFNALRIAHAFAGSDPNARVLVCCIELCSLHQQYTSDAQQIVANALFADGAAAVVAHAKPTDDEAWRLTEQKSLVINGTEDMMSWRIKDHGFEMTLSPKVPDIIREKLAPWLDQWLGKRGLSIKDVHSWAVHPGGPRILTAVGEALSLPADGLDASRSILAEFGNMSSPTVLFIMNRLRQSGAKTPCVALAFGPGLTIEAALLQSGPAAN